LVLAVIAFNLTRAAAAAASGSAMAKATEVTIDIGIADGKVSPNGGKVSVKVRSEGRADGHQ